MNLSTNSSLSIEQSWMFHFMNSISPYKAGVTFIIISFCLLLFSLTYHINNPEHKLKFNNIIICVMSIVFLIHCVVVFVYRNGMFNQGTTHLPFILVLWFTNGTINILSFTMFWMQRKNFYRQSALVNNTPTIVRYFENGLLVTECLTEIIKFLAAAANSIINVNELTDPCFFGLNNHTTVFIMTWLMTLKFLLIILMLQPVLTFWGRIKRSSSNRFSFVMRLRVFRPIICSSLFFLASIVYVFPYIEVEFIETLDCELPMEFFWLMVKAVPLSWLLTVLVSYQVKLPDVLINYFKRKVNKTRNSFSTGTKNKTRQSRTTSQPAIQIDLNNIV